MRRRHYRAVSLLAERVTGVLTSCFCFCCSFGFSSSRHVKNHVLRLRPFGRTLGLLRPRVRPGTYEDRRVNHATEDVVQQSKRPACIQLIHSMSPHILWSYIAPSRVRVALPGLTVAEYFRDEEG